MAGAGTEFMPTTMSSSLSDVLLPEILEMIFLMVSPHVRTLLRLVCKNWCMILQNPGTWKDLDMSIVFNDICIKCKVPSMQWFIRTGLHKFVIRDYSPIIDDHQLFQRAICCSAKTNILDCLVKEGLQFVKGYNGEGLLAELMKRKKMFVSITNSYGTKYISFDEKHNNETEQWIANKFHLTREQIINLNIRIQMRS